MCELYHYFNMTANFTGRSQVCVPHQACVPHHYFKRTSDFTKRNQVCELYRFLQDCRLVCAVSLF